MDGLCLNLKYEWQPFTVGGTHLTFNQHIATRLERSSCSHWGAVVYKWEGLLERGSHSGMVGVLIGETGDIRQRIKGYVNGNQKNGNAYWRQDFLTNGDIYLYALRLYQARFGEEDTHLGELGLDEFESGSRRVAYEQLLVMNETALGRPQTWVVNRKL